MAADPQSSSETRRRWLVTWLLGLGVVVVIVGVSVTLGFIGHSASTVVVERPGGATVQEASGFDWGLWALVFTGLGTTALAVATVALAWYSRSDVEAQWRPVLTVDERRAELATADSNAPGQRRLVLKVSNVGRGPALNIGTEIISPTWLQVTDVPIRQSMAPGDGERPFSWQFMEPKAPQIPLVTVDLRLTYGDISASTFATDVRVTVRGDYMVAGCSQTVHPGKKGGFGRKFR